MRAAAVLTSFALLAGGCFPNNPRHQTIAKVTEGGILLAGIALLAVVNSGADCMNDVSGTPDQDCEDRASLIGNVGLTLVLSGLIGFIVTVSTSGDDKVTTAVNPSPATTAPVAPVAPAPTEPAPTEPAPTEPAPTEAAPTEPAPAGP